jgi:alpha/beta superfamily hydrolase
MRSYRLLLCIALACAAASAFAQDYAREKRWLDEIAPAVVVGDPVMIKASSGREFLGLYTEAQHPRATIVIVHGTGVHPDHSVIGMLRNRLVDQGYNTLSIQMPVLAADAPGEAYAPLFPDAADRIARAADWVATKERAKGQVPKLVLLSHSLGSRMANAYLDTVAVASPPASPFAAWVALGSGVPFTAATPRYPFPIIDIYGEQDLPTVLASAAQRKAALNIPRGSRQTLLARADHFFTGQETALVATVDNFLRDTVARPGQPAK